MKLKNTFWIEGYVLRVLAYIRDSKKLSEVFYKLLVDGELYHHSINVCKIATLLAIEKKMSDADINNVCLAGLFHDVGKVFISKDILYKPYKLTDEEFNIIKKHPESGSELLKSAGVNDEVVKMVLNHHEKYDGTGYPAGIVSKTIPEDIITTADIFSALTENRVYHNALNIHEALSMLNDCNNINKDMVALLSSSIEE